MPGTSVVLGEYLSNEQLNQQSGGALGSEVALSPQVSVGRGRTWRPEAREDVSRKVQVRIAKSLPWESYVCTMTGTAAKMEQVKVTERPSDGIILPTTSNDPYHEQRTKG